MIKSFKGGFAELILNQRRLPKGFPGSIAKVARRKLVQLDAAQALSDLAVPPNNKLHRLKRELAGKHAISINDQWRVIFRWTDDGPEEVEITDYHDDP